MLKQKHQIIGIDNLNNYYSPKFKNQRLVLIIPKKFTQDYIKKIYKDTSSFIISSNTYKELKKAKNNIEYLSVGGQHLNSLGIKSIYDQKDITYIAFTDILLNIFCQFCHL